MPETITSLIEKLEGAEVGSRELDAHVWASVNGYELFEHDGAGWRYRMHPDDIMRHERTSYISPVTTSLDAALALAERVVGGKEALLLLTDLLTREVDASDCDSITLPDLPRLLCAALLRAQSEARV